MQLTLDTTTTSRLGKSEFLDLVVDHQILLNIFVRRGNIGFRLIIVVVTYEILN